MYDGAANTWRKVVIDSVSVKWVDLGTRLVLRHVIRVPDAIKEDDSTNNDYRKKRKRTGGDDVLTDKGGRAGTIIERPESTGHEAPHEDNEGTYQALQRPHRDAVGGGGEEEGGGGGSSLEESTATQASRATTAEVDLSEIRWAESTEGKPRQSTSQTNALPGA